MLDQIFLWLISYTHIQWILNPRPHPCGASWARAHWPHYDLQIISTKPKFSLDEYHPDVYIKMNEVKKRGNGKDSVEVLIST